MRRRRATPIQKSEKRRAVMKDSASVPRAKERKRAMGVEEMITWIRRKVYGLLA